MSIDYTRPAPTSITIRPEPEGQEAYRGWRKPIQKATLGDDDFSKQLTASNETPADSSSTAHASKEVSFWGKDGFGLDDVIDLINPLQHIPIISSIYRAITGDEIAAGPRLIGGGIIGGVIGAVASAADILFEQETGKDIGENVMAMVSGSDHAEPALASATASAKATETKVANIQREHPRAMRQPRENISHSVTTHSQPASENLTPLDFSQIETQAKLQSVDANVIGSAGGSKGQSILDLYDPGRSKAQQDYLRAQSLAKPQAIMARNFKL